MGARARFRGSAGFTVIELTGLVAIVAILSGSLLPAVQKLRGAGDGMERSPALAALGRELLAFGEETEGAAQIFFLDLAAAAEGSDGAALTAPLASFCGADDRLAALRAEIATRLAARRLPAVQRKRLAAAQDAIDGLLPAVQRLGGLLQSRTDGPCAP